DPTGPYVPKENGGTDFKSVLPSKKEEEAASTIEDRCPKTDTDSAKPRSSALDPRTSSFFRTVAQLGIQAAEAVDHAHQMGVIHDHRTDIYSLGVTLYELLTLQPAFPATDRHELLRQVAFDEPRPLRRLNKSIPAEMETIVLKAMEKNPTDRYGTAQEMAEDL